MRLLFACIFALVGICFLLDFLMGSQCITSLSGSGISTAAIVGLVSIDDVNDRQTSGSEIAYLVYLVEVHQIDLSGSNKFPAAEISTEGVRSVTGPIPLVEQAKVIYIEAHDIPTLLSSWEKGDITTTGTNTFTIIVGNPNRNEVANFIEQQQGGKFIMFYKHVKSDQYYILGEPERPVIFSAAEIKDDKDGRYATLTFSRSSVDLPYPFIGKVPSLEAPEA